MSKLDTKMIENIALIATKNQWPEFSDFQCPLSNNDDETMVEISCTIPKALVWFEGHYPDQPVLPGVVQVNWIYELAHVLFTTNDFRGVNSLKFNNMILPETHLSISMKYNHSSHSLTFFYRDEDMVFSSGTMKFSQAA